MKVYVTMTDKALSGFGNAYKKINKLVIECNTWQEAEIVAANASRRSEMKYINICTKKPSYPSNRYYVSYENKTSYPNWFKPGVF